MRGLFCADGFRIRHSKWFWIVTLALLALSGIVLGARERRGNHERRLVDHAAGRGFGAKRVDLGMDRQ